MNPTADVGRRRTRLGQGGKHVADLAEPAALLLRLVEHLAQRAPESERAVTRGEQGRAHATALAVAQQISPRAGRLVAVRERDELLGAVHAHADEHGGQSGPAAAIHRILLMHDDPLKD